ncbi:MAG: patatin-like phospholipase family protein [Tunicatimonas sp.]
MNRLKNVLESLRYSLLVQLLILHVRKNQLLLLGWGLLLAMVTGNFGKDLGLPYLLLDPEYLGRVDTLSFLIVGISLGGFTMAYHITCYILDGPSFGFLGTQSRPFAKFALNNAVIPVLFMLVYAVAIVNFQLDNEYESWWSVVQKILGLLGGFLLMTSLLFSYFRFTNKDIFRFLAANVDKRLRRVQVSRVRVMANLKDAKRGKKRVDSYLDLSLRVRKAPTADYDKALVIKVFDQHHLNSIIIESLILLLILALGIFQSSAYFQIPAAASGVLLLTIVLMLVGALSYWLRGWATTAIIAAFFAVNALVSSGLLDKPYAAFGLDYHAPRADYTLASLRQANSVANYRRDTAATLEILDTWYQREMETHGTKPKMVLICTSGGGLRSTLWTTTALQAADSLTNGRLMDQTRLITGASGGLIGAAYFRELVLQQRRRATPPIPEPIVLAAQSSAPSIYSRYYLDRVAQDNLNPMVFTLLVNDLFVRHQSFTYAGNTYAKDRGYAFERQFNQNTGGILDKKLIDYRADERAARTPMLLLSPAVVNDGRKMFISAQSVSYMNPTPTEIAPHGVTHYHSKVKGVDFMRFFAEQGSEQLPFLTALRMNAAFPYVTPNVTLPTKPRIQIMDAGITDNFGVSDAVRFTYVFQDWINAHTSGVVLLTVRDSEKDEPISTPDRPSMIQKMTGPFRFLYENLFNIQDVNNDDRLEYADAWLDVSLDRVSLKYSSYVTEPDAFGKFTSERPSLSWRLTSREKNNLIHNIHHPNNQRALAELQQLLR